MTDFSKILEKAKEIELKVKESQEKIKNIKAEGSSGGGQVKIVLNDLGCNTAHLYFNISTKAETFGKHKDTMDVYYWQCQGVTHWIVEDKNVILNPGDLIYIPTGMYHSVTPLSPRLGI